MVGGGLGIRLPGGARPAHRQGARRYALVRPRGLGAGLGGPRTGARRTRRHGHGCGGGAVALRRWRLDLGGAQPALGHLALLRDPGRCGRVGQPVAARVGGCPRRRGGLRRRGGRAPRCRTRGPGGRSGAEPRASAEPRAAPCTRADPRPRHRGRHRRDRPRGPGIGIGRGRVRRRGGGLRLPLRRDPVPRGGRGGCARAGRRG
jgi:hypothetical protein